METPVRLLHGFLEPRILLQGIHNQMSSMGFTNVKKVTYPSYLRSFPTMIDKAVR